MQYGTNTIVYIIVLLISVVILAYSGFHYYKKRFQTVKKVDTKANARRQAIAAARENAAVGGGVGVVGVREQATGRERLIARMRANRRVQPAQHQIVDSSSSDESDQQNERLAAANREMDGTSTQNGEENSEKKKIGVKKQRKLDEKKQRKEEREAMEREREERKKLEAQLDKEKKAKEAEETRVEEERLAEIKRQREEEERREAEEYERMKAEFCIEEEGEEALKQDETFQQNFLKHILDHKVVMVEELASNFKIKTNDCIEIIQDHLSKGNLSGVLDDRGKFIYISQSEYEAVAKFIRQRGRVSIKELAENSNRLIQLSQPPSLALTTTTTV